MKYILIIFVIFNNRPALTTAEFDSMRACTSAAEAVNTAYGTMSKNNVKAICSPKADK